MPLQDIPFYGAYVQKRMANEAQPMQQLQQASGALALQGAMQKQAQAQQAQAELAGLGANPSQEQLAVWAAKHSGPEAVMRAQTSSLDRKSTLEAQALQFAMTLDTKKEALAQQKELALSRAADKAAQDIINNDFKTRQLVLDEQNKGFQRWLAQQNLDIKKLLATREQGAPVAVIGHDGKPVLVPRSEAIGKTPATAGKPLTEFQGRNVLFGTRAAQSDKILKTLEDKVSLTGMAAAGTLGAAGNFVMSSEQRRVRQAQRDFVNAVLRQESGAVISDAEFDNATKQYFPAAGDDDKTIAQKRANRALAIKGFARLAGPGGEEVQSIIDAPFLPGAPQAPGGPKRLKFDAQGNQVQ